MSTMPGSTRSKVPPAGILDMTMNSTHQYIARPLAAHRSSTLETDDNPDTESESNSVSNTFHAQERKRAWKSPCGNRESEANKVIAKRIVESMKSAVIQCTRENTMNSSSVDQQSKADHISRFTHLIADHPNLTESLGLSANTSSYRFDAVAAKGEACFEPSMAVTIVPSRTNLGDQTSGGLLGPGQDPKSVYLTDGLYPDPDTRLMVPSSSIHIVPFQESKRIANTFWESQQVDMPDIGPDDDFTEEDLKAVSIWEL